MLASKVTSGILAPAPPITKAATVPIAIPLPSKVIPMGIILSARMYMGMPMTAAIGIYHKSFSFAVK